MGMKMSQKVDWLYDRAQIGDLLHRFAYYLNTKRWQDWIELFADDGVLVLPDRTKGKATLIADGGPKGLLDLHATHYISSNHSIEIDGDVARSHSYLLAVHVVDPADQKSGWMVGSYDNEYRRTEEGWRIARAKRDLKWTWELRFPAG